MKIPETSRVKFSVGRLAAGLVLIASIAGAGFASAAERNLGARPAGVPADYVITPFGYFSPACIQQIHSGDQITQDGGIQRVTGSLEQRKICSQDNFTRDGVRVKPDGRTLEGKLARTIDGNSVAQTKAVLPLKLHMIILPMEAISRLNRSVELSLVGRSRQIQEFDPIRQSISSRECRVTQFCSQY